MRCARLSVVILFQSLAIYGAQQLHIKRKPKSNHPAYLASRYQLNIALDNNALIHQNNILLTQLLEATTRANILAAEHVKAIQEQNKIHLELVRMQQSASHDQSGDFKSEPSSPSSSACQTPAPSLSSSMSRNVHHRLASAAHEIAHFVMMAPAAQSSRVSLSASTPNLQDLVSGASIRRKGRSGPSLPTVLSPVNVEAAAAPADSVNVQTPIQSSATFLSPDSSVILAHAKAQPEGNGASAAAAAGAALKIQVTPVKDE